MVGSGRVVHTPGCLESYGGRPGQMAASGSRFGTCDVATLRLCLVYMGEEEGGVGDSAKRRG